MIKVLHITPRMDQGGVASVLRNFYSVLNHNEVHFDFVSHSLEESLTREAVDSESRYYYFRTIGQIGFRGYKKQILEQIDMSSYDIVHVHLGDITGIYAMVFRMCGAKRVVNHGHGSQPVDEKRRSVEWLLRILARTEADVCIGCGVEAGDFLFGRNRYVLLPNGIDFVRFQRFDASLSDELLKRIGGHNRKIVTAMGDLYAVKNHLFLLDVINSLRGQVPDVLLVVAGEGPEREKLEDRVSQLGLEQYVRLPGRIDAIAELIYISKAFVMPSLHEGIPMSAIEAQATGIPCVLSDRIDKDVDIGNEYTYFYSIDDGVESWVSLLAEILRNGYWDKTNDIDKRLADSGFDVRQTAKRLQSIYASLMRDKPSD